MDLRTLYLAAKDNNLGQTIDAINRLQTTDLPERKIFKVILDDYLNSTFSPSQFIECIITVLQDNPNAVGQRAPADGPVPNAK